MYSNVYGNEGLLRAKQFLNDRQYDSAFKLLNNMNDRCAEWYYLAGTCAIKLGYYEQGEDYIKRSANLDPNNIEYQNAVSQFSNYRDDYRRRSDRYNRRRRADIDGCCCCCCDGCCCCDDLCCCGDDCCDTIGKIWCLDSMCECCGGDLVDCM